MNKSPYITSRVYAYGCLPPSREDERKVFAHLRLANAYYNHLISVEMEARSIFNSTLQELIPGLVDLEGRIQAARETKEEAQKLAKQSRAGKRVTDQTAKDAFEEAKRSFRELCELRAKTKKEATEAREKAKRAANDFRAAADHEARFWFGPKMGGLCWRTTGFYEKAAKTARKSAKLSRKRFEGEGCIGGQVMEQTGLESTKIWSNQTITVDRIDPQVYALPRGQRRKATRTKATFRLSSGESVTLPVIMHRPLPENGKITEIRVQVLQRAGKPVYSLLVTLGFYEEPRKATGTGVCGLDLGWSASDSDPEVDGHVLTVGAVAGDQGAEVLTLDVGKHLHAESVQSATDKEFDEAKQHLLDACKALGETPRELRDLHKWRSHGRLRRAIHRLSKLGHPLADRRMVDWLRHSRHRRYVDHIRHDAREARKHHYRNIAARLSKQYHTVVLENLNLAAMGRQGEVANTSAKTQFNWQLKAAAVNELRLALKNVGLRVVEVNPAFTSQTCSECGSVDAKSRVSRALFQCSSCGHSTHADVNAAINIRARGIESLGGAKTPVPARISKISNTSVKALRSLFALREKNQRTEKNLSQSTS